ncbi:dynamin family protein [Roseburia faecis]|uniref:dynamin family protein n=1 Tax=Roseburia faecis TaxID=301302 RepID=UPI003F96BFE2
MPISSYEDMKEKKNQIVHLLIDLADIVDRLNEMGLEINGSALLDLKKKLESDKFKVLVIGEFKNGKSTFINSLMGEKVLPAYSTPCTAVINEVIYGKDKKAMLFFKNPLPENISSNIAPDAMQYLEKYKGQEVPPIELDVNELEDYVVIPDPTKDQADSIKELPYSKVVLEYPIEICHDGIEIIDSPGLNENGTRTKVTEEYLNKADAILFVFRCPKIAGASEIDYITDQIRARGHEDIFFICNAIDQVSEEEQDRLIEFGNKKLSPLTALGENGIFYVNSFGALKAKKEKDAALLTRTGIPEFENALSEYLRNNRGKTKLMQIITPCKSFIDILKNQHIKGYIALLDQDVAALEKKIKDAMPKLDFAEKKKELVVKKIELEMQELEKNIKDLMNAQYGVIIGKIPQFVEDMNLDNHMTVNPFKQKEKKEALEKEVLSRLEQFVQKEMGAWIKKELKQTIDVTIDRLQQDIGDDIDIFYENLDEFRYQVSGVEKPKDISGVERVSSTILGTIVGGPMYGVVGASLGFGEIAKRSAITMGATCAGAAILAFTPVGIAAITTATTVAVIGAGVLQLATSGKALTDKYKRKLKEGFIDSLKEGREEGCKNYAKGITSDVKEKFNLVKEALDNEIKIEKSKIQTLKKDKEDSVSERTEKLVQLREYEQELMSISNTLIDIGHSIE